MPVLQLCNSALAVSTKHDCVIAGNTYIDSNPQEVFKLTKVGCKVASCDFWGKSGFCTADEIMVNNDTGDVKAKMSSGMNGDDVEFADESMGDRKGRLAKSSRQTQCETMRPKH